jgi:hypothetical protein
MADKRDKAEYLMLCVTNEGKLYQEALHLARGESTITEYGTALQWVRLVQKKARELREQFNETFTARDYLRAAEMCAKHYAQHIAEGA